ncbi:MAG: DUF981 family protein [Vicinamibacterales bacterium]
MSTLLAQSELVIDWENLPTYNTIMAVAAGAALITLVRLGRELHREPGAVSVDGYVIAFAVTGFILTVTGTHMTLTWPLAPDFPFDNIVFGETSLGFGVLLLAAAWFTWRRGAAMLAEPDPVGAACRVARPVSIFVFGLGASLIAIGVAGMRYRLFAAPPVEPISGWYFARWPWVEASFISGLWALVGVGAIAAAIACNRHRSWLAVAGWAWLVSGATLLAFGILNFFTHIGLIVETM